MPSNAVPGIIIAATVLIAAGVAIYEINPQLRAWLEESRRRIALALQNLGPDVQHGSRREQEESEEVRERRRWFEEGLEAEMRRAGWNGEVFQRPGMDSVNMELRRRRRSRGSTIQRSSSQSFDNLLSEDGSLRREHHAVATSSSGSRGFDRGASAGNPFSDEFEVTDEKSQMLFDQDLIGAAQDDVLEHEKEAIIGRSRESTATIRGNETQEPLIDISEGPSRPQPSGPKSFFDNMIQSFMPAASTPRKDDEFEMQMRRAIQASLHDTHGDSSMLSTEEDADLNAAIAASLQDDEAQEERISKGKEPETRQTRQSQPLASLTQPNPWSDLSESTHSFHSARGSSESSFIMPVPSTSSLSAAPPAGDSHAPEMVQSSPVTSTNVLHLPIPIMHTGQSDELYSLTPPAAQTPTSASFITSPTASHPSSPRSEAFSEPFSTFTPSRPALATSDFDVEPITHLEAQSQVLPISPLGGRSSVAGSARLDEEMSEVSGWSEVDAGVATPADWTDVESEAEEMSEDGQQVQGQGRVPTGTQARL